MYRIGDFLIQIKNAYQAGKKQIVYPHSKVAESIGKILVSEKYVSSSKVKSQKTKTGLEVKVLEIDLKYDGRVPAIVDIKLVSKPSVHQYIAKNKLGRSVATHGIAIISTSSGMMTHREAAKLGIGGELVCRIF